jgi:uncharacterized membrane protein YbhN (UPF0104 family)
MSLSRLRAPAFRRALNAGMLLFGVAVTALAGRQVAGMGWPLSHADAGLAAAAGVLFLAGYGVKARGWKLLFAPHERPETASLCAAGGAACITGIALPGRFDDVVRIAVVRRLRGCPAGVKALMFSLVTLGLIDTVALTPLASSAAVAASVPTYLRIGLAVVAAAGVAAAAAVVVAPRVARHRRLLRFRLSRFVGDHAPCPRSAARALAWVLASWLIRGLALVLLLGAVGLGLDLSTALLFLTAGAASAALPIAPAGAATQAGAGAGVLVLSGISWQQATSFALAAQILVILAGAAALVASWAWHAACRVRARRAAAVMA